MNRIIGFLKRLLCMHQYECISDVMDPTVNISNVRFKCLKCGKETGLT